MQDINNIENFDLDSIDFSVFDEISAKRKINTLLQQANAMENPQGINKIVEAILQIVDGFKGSNNYQQYKEGIEKQAKALRDKAESLKTPKMLLKERKKAINEESKKKVVNAKMDAYEENKNELADANAATAREKMNRKFMGKINRANIRHKTQEQKTQDRAIKLATKEPGKLLQLGAELGFKGAQNKLKAHRDVQNLTREALIEEGIMQGPQLPPTPDATKVDTATTMENKTDTKVNPESTNNVNDLKKVDEAKLAGELGIKKTSNNIADKAAKLNITPEEYKDRQARIAQRKQEINAATSQDYKGGKAFKTNADIARAKGDMAAFTKYTQANQSRNKYQADYRKGKQNSNLTPDNAKDTIKNTKSYNKKSDVINSSCIDNFNEEQQVEDKPRVNNFIKPLAKLTIAGIIAYFGLQKFNKIRQEAAEEGMNIIEYVKYRYAKFLPAIAAGSTHNKIDSVMPSNPLLTPYE